MPVLLPVRNESGSVPQLNILFNTLSNFKHVNSLVDFSRITVKTVSQMSSHKTKNRRMADLPGQTQNTHNCPFRYALNQAGMAGGCSGKCHSHLMKKDLGSYRLVTLISVTEKKM